MVFGFWSEIMGFLDNYLDLIRKRGNIKLAESIDKTAYDIKKKAIDDFNYREHIVGLLIGDVQSGKTSQMFGIMCMAADAGFANFILLTTDNIILQQQTLKRACNDLQDFLICDENDYITFVKNNMRKPAVIILKKNGHVLNQWKNNLSSTKFGMGNPLFIVDDEADAASLNTKVNQRSISTINKNLKEIKQTSSSSIYLQVTGTPQAILLQTVASGWKPQFMYYFKPGNEYMGGNFFFGDMEHKNVIFTDDQESHDILTDDEFPENGLKSALLYHLIASSQLFLAGKKVSNFLIHPSVKISQHKAFAEKIGNYLNEVNGSIDEDVTIESLKNVYNVFAQEKKDMFDFGQIYDFIKERLATDKIKILILNSIASYQDNVQYQDGINIIVGGNSLGRGVTFPQLQTVYYCRLSKNPQADTMWQHARMFGYDRDSRLMRVFMPPMLYKLFVDINKTNNNIILQLLKYDAGEDIKITYPSGLKPTRKNVLDKNAVEIFIGGVNYFPLYPINDTVNDIDILMEKFADGEYMVSLKLFLEILGHIVSERGDWDNRCFSEFIKTILADNSLAQGELIIRRCRNIGRGTGTLLSPNDRKLGDLYNDVAVLTMYKVIADKGWTEEIWIPNIKLPGGNIYYYNVSECIHK
jgi:hypothetical protein